MVLPYYGLAENYGSPNANYYVIPASAYDDPEYKRLETERKSIETEAAKYGITPAELSRIAFGLKNPSPQSVTSSSYAALPDSQKYNATGYYEWSGSAPEFQGVWRNYWDKDDPNSSAAFNEKVRQYPTLGSRYGSVSPTEFLKSKAVATGKAEYDKYSANQWGYKPPEIAPPGPTSYMSIQAVGPVQPAQTEDAIYDTSGNTYEQAYQKYLQQIEDNKANSASLSKNVDDARAVYLSGLKDPAEIRASLDKLQGAIKASSDYALSFLKSPLTAPRKEDFTNTRSYTPTSAVSPETQKNLSIVQSQAEEGNTASQEFLKNYSEENLTASAQTAQTPQGPSTPVKYDPVMKQYVPNVDPGKVLLDILKRAEAGPRGELLAQGLTPGPRGMDRAPGSYDRRNIIPLQTPGSNWRPGEGYMIQNPFERSPQTGPGLSKGPRGEAAEVASILPPLMERKDLYRAIQERGGASPGTKEYGELRDLQKEWIQRQQKLEGAEAPVFDEQKAQVATKAADQYRRQAQTQDPFRSGAFG